LLSSQFNVSNPNLVAALVSFNTKILRELNLSQRVEKTRSFLGSSPVKMLTSFLSSSSASASDAALTPKLQRPPVSALFPPAPISRSNSSIKDSSSSLYGSAKSKDGIKLGIDDDRPENPLVRLEQTFTGYMACLHARKGNFIGRMILNRGAVDELSVNDLYNKLIESPFDVEGSSDLSADIVFVAFEKFVRIAWRDQMGPIMSLKSLDALQERVSKRVPGEFADFVRFLFADMAPQNRRAFTALIKLLADLLDGCGNDGDRGALTLAFAELLVDDGSGHNYINLLDRLVEDCDRIFDGASPELDSAASNALSRSGSPFNSVNSTTRSIKSHTGSLTSNTSSLRRKLGFDNLLRQNSKDERSSMWRTLSKHGRNPATGESSSLSKASVARARSVDVGTPGPNKLRRPGSRDRPPLAGAFDDNLSRPVSSYRLETIGEPEIEELSPKSTKKKRRSSLSDLKNLMDATTLEDEDDPPQALSHMKVTSQKFNSGPRIQSPSRIPISPLSPGRSPRQKENFIDPFQGGPISSPPAQESTPQPRKGHSKGFSTSNIPTLKSARSAPGNLPDSPGSPTRPSTSSGRNQSNRLRLQSPQKLRERLQTEKQIMDEVDASLKSELSRITADMARMNSTLPRSSNVDVKRLSSNLAALESRIPKLIQDFNNRHGALQRDMDNTLKATEAKVKEIDQLYKESTAEIELLYEKFNTELTKIVRALKGKSAEKEDLVTKVKEATEETARVKKENARLRREMASMRAMIKGAPTEAT
jgi:hypothetical protein